MSATQKNMYPPGCYLVFSLARNRGSLRVAVWRKLQRFGALPLGNSGYLIPNHRENRERFEWLATTIRSEARQSFGCGSSFHRQPFSASIETNASLKRETTIIRLLLRDIRKISTTSSASRRAARMRQRFQEIVSIDFFASPLRDQVEHAVNDLQKPKAEGSHFELGKISRASISKQSMGYSIASRCGPRDLCLADSQVYRSRG